MPVNGVLKNSTSLHIIISQEDLYRFYWGNDVKLPHIALKSLIYYSVKLCVIENQINKKRIEMSCRYQCKWWQLGNYSLWFFDGFMLNICIYIFVKNSVTTSMDLSGITLKYNSVSVNNKLYY